MKVKEYCKCKTNKDGYWLNALEEKFCCTCAEEIDYKLIKLK